MILPIVGVLALIFGGIVMRMYGHGKVQRQAQRFESFKEEPGRYGVVFAPSPERVGIKLNFPEFRLVHTYFRNLTDQERQRKRQAIEAGMDGGTSMISPLNGFEVRQLDDRLVENFELSILPYASHVFIVKGARFEIRNAEQGWIVRALN